MSMGMDSPRIRRKVALGYDLLERNPETQQVLLVTNTNALEASALDVHIKQHRLEDFIAGQDHTSDSPEFVEHQCWRMLFVYPHDADPTLPGMILCMGCGMAGRFEMEYKP